MTLLAGVAACSDESDDTAAGRACGDEGVVALLGRERPAVIGRPEVVAVSADGEARGVSGDWVTPDGAMAPDGTIVLVRADGDYESAGPGPETLWVRSAGGSEPRQLTDGPNDSAPAVSPDGGEVAFAQRDQDEGTLRYRVARVPIGGGDVVGVTPWDDAGLLGDVAWSPDGEQLAYLRRPYDGGPGDPAPVELRVVDAGGGTGRRVAAVPDGNWLTWGGDTLLVGTLAAEAGTIERVDPAGGEVERVSDEASAPALAPAGEGLAYLAYRREPAAGSVVGDTTIWRLALGEAVGGRVEATRDLVDDVGYLYPYLGVSAGPCL